MIQVKKLHENATLPTRATTGSAGTDLYACEKINIWPGHTVMVPLGFSMEIPDGYVGLIFARSGLATKRDLAPANKVGVIDSDYRGEWVVALHNHGQRIREVEAGERIAQLVIVPCLIDSFEFTEELSTTERGNGGFGSTGNM